MNVCVMNLKLLHIIRLPITPPPPVIRIDLSVTQWPRRRHVQFIKTLCLCLPCFSLIVIWPPISSGYCWTLSLVPLPCVGGGWNVVGVVVALGWSVARLLVARAAHHGPCSSSPVPRFCGACLDAAALNAGMLLRC